MASGIFYLDEDRDREPSPVSSPSHSPNPQVLETSTSSLPISQSLGPLAAGEGMGDELDNGGSLQLPSMPSAKAGSEAAVGRAPSVMPIPSYTAEPTQVTSPAPAVSPPPTVTSPPTAASLHVPSGPSVISQSQAFGRKSGVFAATPSFPSPLAQAITVPSHSDTSSSSSHSSPHHSDEELVLDEWSPSKHSQSSHHSKSRSASSPSDTTTASSSRRSSRPPSPGSSRQAVSPGTILMNRARRSGSGSLLSGSSVLPSLRSKQEAKAMERGRDKPPPHVRGHVPKHHSLHSPPSGSSDQEVAEPIVSPQPVPALSPSMSRDRDSNLLGLGYWDVTSPPKGGKGKEAVRSPSPRKETSSPSPMAK